jgi:hypothetical protein
MFHISVNNPNVEYLDPDFLWDGVMDNDLSVSRKVKILAILSLTGDIRVGKMNQTPGSMAYQDEMLIFDGFNIRQILTCIIQN